MLIVIRNYSEKKLEQTFINENLSQFNYVEYVKTQNNKQFEDVKNEEKDFILIKDSKMFNNQELTELRNNLRQYNITGILIDNSKKYNHLLEEISDNIIQINNSGIINKFTKELMNPIQIIKCQYHDISCFPIINIKEIKL